MIEIKLSQQQPESEIIEYHPPEPYEFGDIITEGVYTINRIEFTISLTCWNIWEEVVYLKTTQGKFYSFSGVLRKQLKQMMANIGMKPFHYGESIIYEVKPPRNITVKETKTNHILV